MDRLPQHCINASWPFLLVFVQFIKADLIACNQNCSFYGRGWNVVLSARQCQGCQLPCHSVQAVVSVPFCPTRSLLLQIPFEKVVYKVNKLYHLPPDPIFFSASKSAKFSDEAKISTSAMSTNR